MTSLSLAEMTRLLRAENRRKARRKLYGRIVTNVLVSTVAAFWRGWMLMLAVGIIHDEWAPQVPTLGYWWAVLIVWLLMGVFSQVDYAKANEKAAEK